MLKPDWPNTLNDGLGKERYPTVFTFPAIPLAHSNPVNIRILPSVEDNTILLAYLTSNSHFDVRNRD